jgi:hypothetical protein
VSQEFPTKIIHAVAQEQYNDNNNNDHLFRTQGTHHEINYTHALQRQKTMKNQKGANKKNALARAQKVYQRRILYSNTVNLLKFISFLFKRYETVKKLMICAK